MERGSVLLELDGIRPGPLFFARPLRELAARTPAEVAAVLCAVEAEAARGRWAAGFLAYEAAPALEPALHAKPAGPLPLAWFGVYDGPSAAEPGPAGDASLGPLVPDVDRPRYLAAVERIRERIGRGDA